MSSTLDILASVRKKLVNPKHNNGEIKGNIAIDTIVKGELVSLIQNSIVDNIVVVGAESIAIDKLDVSAHSVDTSITLYTNNLSSEEYFETIEVLLKTHNYIYPQSRFYVNEIDFFSDSSIIPEKIKQYQDILKLIDLLLVVSDAEQEYFGQYRELIFFQKRKLLLQTIYGLNQLNNISFLSAFETQINSAHDKEERKTIFKTELVSTLLDYPESTRFSQLISSWNKIYDNYLKSHLLYLEKFSYHDLKSEVDKDKMDYTKRIYGVVNEIQTKLITVPAAFLLVFSQFDYMGADLFKNIFITVGAFLFSVLLEVLLRNQFDVLDYIKKEVAQFKDNFKNEDTALDLSEFIISFGDLDEISKRQKIYLGIFRVIVWSVAFAAVALILKVNSK